MDYSTLTNIDTTEINRAFDILVDKTNYVMLQSLNPQKHHHTFGNGRELLHAIVDDLASVRRKKTVFQNRH